ncbi:MAG: D-2-hydroxyacid dehydrogenase [Woeseiaceae bacterium]
MNKYRIVIAALLLGLVTPGRAELTIDELIEASGLEPGAVAMREVPAWDASRKIVVRDMGVSMAGLKKRYGDSLVIVTSLAQAHSNAGGAGAIVGYCDAALLAAAPMLSWVQIFSSGAERCLDVPQISDGDLVLTNMQKMSSPMIGEHAIAMLLALSRNLPTFARAMPEGRWSRAPAYTAGMTTVSDKTMLVLGLGGIGTEVARRASALGMRVIGTRNSSREGPDFVDYVGLSDETLLLAAKAQVVVNALPLTESTRGLVDAEFFAALQPGTYFINVGRGATVNTADLVDALRNGRLAGAGLDVTEPEPLPSEHPLWTLDNVIITPHVSSRGSGRQRHMLVLTENIRRYLAGEALLNVVDPKRGY